MDNKKYKYFRQIAKILLLFCLCSGQKIYAQMNEGILDARKISNLIETTRFKSEMLKDIALNEYQNKFRITFTSLDKNIKHSNLYEEYCLYKKETGKTLCRGILIESDNTLVPVSKIEKERKKTAELFVKKDKLSAKSDDSSKSSGYDISGYINDKDWILINPIIYLKDCQITSSAETTVEARKTVFLRLGNCSIAKEPLDLIPQLSYISKTNAEIWIDEQDAAVTQMNIYTQRDSSAEIIKDKPIIRLENVRTIEGYWLNKQIFFESNDIKLFPNLKYKWQYEFFDYKHLRVDVNSNQPDAK